MKIPRDISAQKLIKELLKLGYTQTRQVGSHIRLTLIKEGRSHHITIPNHDPINIGTPNNILKDAGHQLKISKDELIKNLN